MDIHFSPHISSCREAMKRSLTDIAGFFGGGIVEPVRCPRQFLGPLAFKLCTPPNT